MRVISIFLNTSLSNRAYGANRGSLVPNNTTEPWAQLSLTDY